MRVKIHLPQRNWGMKMKQLFLAGKICEIPDLSRCKVKKDIPDMIFSSSPLVMFVGQEGLWPIHYEKYNLKTNMTMEKQPIDDVSPIY